MAGLDLGWFSSAFPRGGVRAQAGEHGEVVRRPDQIENVRTGEGKEEMAALTGEKVRGGLPLDGRWSPSGCARPPRAASSSVVTSRAASVARHLASASRRPHGADPEGRREDGASFRTCFHSGRLQSVWNRPRSGLFRLQPNEALG